MYWIWNFLFFVVNSVFVVGIDCEEFELGFGGFCNGIFCVLIVLLVWSVLIFFLIVFNNLLIFYILLLDFCVIFSCILLGSFDMMIGINRLLYFWDDIFREDRFCICMFNLL